MQAILPRRKFVQQLALGTAGIGLLPFASAARNDKGFGFAVLGDLHFDKLRHHDLESLGKEKPDDLRQVRDYSRITADIQPKLFQTLRDAIQPTSGRPPVDFVLQVGDLVEGLCGSEERAHQQDIEALEFVRQSQFGVPFMFTKGNHDITGPGAREAFKAVFHPFLAEQAARVQPASQLDGARLCLEHGDALFCFFDAYDNESLPWLEAALNRRTARHCFVVIHPPVVPYGARSTWHIFSREEESSRREHLLQLLGRHNAFVLSGHIHKYNLLVRATAGGRFLQLAVSSVIGTLPVEARNILSGVGAYNGDQVTVEPAFSPQTEAQRRAVYATEAPSVKEFQYADVPGYAMVSVQGAEVTAEIYAGTSRQPWRRLELSTLLKTAI